MISPRGRLVLIILLLSSSAVFYTLPLLHSEPQAPRPVPSRPPKARTAPKPDLQQDPLDRSPRRIGAGERHLYRFDLKPEEFVLFVVEQEGVDLMVEVLDRAGKLLFRVDSLNWDRGPEPVPLLAESESLFDVKVSGVEGAYRVRIDRWRQAITVDRAWTAGAYAYWQGRDLAARKAPGDQIEKSFREAAREWEKAGHVEGQADAFCKLGEHYKERSRTTEAISAFLESLPLFRRVENQRQEVMVRIEIGSIYKDLGENEKAETYFRQALNLAEEGRVSDGEAKSLVHLADLLKKRGESTEALASFLRALELSKNDKKELIRTSNKIGRLYMDLGRFEEAHRYHDRARKLLQGLNLPEEEAATWTHFGDYRLYKKEYLLAEVFYNRSLNIYKDLDDTRSKGLVQGKAAVFNNLGLVYYNQGRFQEANDVYRRALPLFERLKNLEGQSVVLTNIGSTYDAVEKPTQALSAFAQALEIAERNDYKWTQVAVYFGMAWTERHRNNLIAAQQWVEKAIEIIENLRTKIGEPVLRSSFLSRMQDVYELHVSILMERHERQPGKGFDLNALEASDRARARSLYDDLSGRIEPPRPTFRDIQQMLDPGTVLLHYFLDDGRSHVFVVTPGSFARYPLSGREILEPLARKLHASIQESQKGEAFPRAVQDACRMSRELLGPLSGKIGKRRIVVVAPAALQYVPFAALPVDFSKACTPNDDRRWPEPLIFRHQIVQVPSLAVLAALRNRTARRKPTPDLIAILADPVFGPYDDRLRLLKGAAAGDEESDAKLRRLPYTEGEANAILSALPGARRLRLLGFDATRDLAVKGKLDSFQIIHFATHALPNPTVPASSAIVLSRYDSQGRRLNGRLQASDVEDLNLSADLVVLSACGTALGQEIPGEGLVGLTQAFFSAGSPRVVVTLWNVNDQSSVRLMETFYKRLRQDGPAAALQRAQVEMWQSKTRSAPYFWAQFVLQGEWRNPL
jgi:CHAT domain-containing protein/tetratricopeptide (TPR) repeat protein